MKRALTVLAVLLVATSAYAFTDDADIQRATSHVESKELATKPTAPPATYHNVYPKSDGLYIQNSSDVETKIGPVGTDGIGVDELDDDVDTPADEDCVTYEASTTSFEYQPCGAGGGSNSFETIDAESGTDPVADSGTDTLIVTGSTGITVTGDSGADSIDISIASGAISATELGTDSVGSDEIAAGAVGQSEIAAGGVASSEIQDGSITAADLGNNSVDFPEIAADAVRTGEIQDDAVGTADLNDGSDTPVAGECVVVATGATAFEYTTCGSGGGDSVSIDGGAVVDPDFVSTGDIDFVDTSNTITANINNGSVTGAHILNGTITSADIGSDQIGTTHIADGSITDTDIQDGTLEPAEMDDGADTPADEDCLTYEATGTIFEWQACGGGMSDLIDDTTPQLGGNLDVNGFTVDGRDPSADGVVIDATSGTNTGDEVVATSAEVTTGTDNVKYISPSALNASTPTLGGANISQDQTNPAADFYSGVESLVTVNPTGTTSAINFGVRGDVTMENGSDQAFGATHHGVAGFFYVKNENAGTTNPTTPFLIGVEGKCENLVAKTLTTCVGSEAQLSSNLVGGTVTSWIGHNSSVTGSEGDVGAFTGFNMEMSGFNGNMTTATFGNIANLDEDAAGGATGDLDFLYVLNVEDQTSNDSAILGYRMADQTGTHATQDYLRNECILCRSLLGNSVLWQGTTSGTVEIKAPAVSGTSVLTLPAETGTIATDATYKIATGHFTKVMSSADSTETIASLTGTPYLIEFTMSNAGGESSYGWTDCTTEESHWMVAGFPGYNNTAAIYVDHGYAGTDLLKGEVDGTNGGCTSTGFTLDWTKTGSGHPTETLEVSWKAYYKD